MAPHASVVARLKVHLKLSIARLRIVQARDQAVAKQQRRAMAQLLEQGKQESARIRVENIIRSDLLTELHEVLELYCELLLARIGLLDNMPTPYHSSAATSIDPGLEEAVRSIIYVAPRTDIKELNAVRALLVEKFGRDFAQQAMDNKGDVKIPDRISRKLRVEPPSTELVESYLTEIANAYDVPYGESAAQAEETEAAPGEDDAADDDDEPGSGGQAEKAKSATKKSTKPALEAPLSTEELSAMTPPRTFDPGLTSPVRIAPPSPSTDNANPKLKLPGTNATVATTPASTRKMELRPGGKAAAAGNVKKPEGDIPDVNDLEKRFAMLKR